MAGREPERTCVGCRVRAPKRSLLRIVRRPGGAVDVDPRGSAPGRGAYVHRAQACVDAALRRAALARALRLGRGLAPDEVGRLRTRIEGELIGT
ncbi:MAG TPA: YlxR family protein [Actinomycetota bacterium]